MLVLAVGSISCSVNTITNGTSQVKLSGLGNKTKFKSMRVGDIRIEEWEEDNSQSFREVVVLVQRMWRGYLIANVIKYINGEYFDYKGDKLDSDQVIQLEELRNAKSIADAEAAQKALETNLAFAAETQ